MTAIILWNTRYLERAVATLRHTEDVPDHLLAHLSAELQEPGAQVRAVAARHGVCASLVFTWRRQVREGVLTEPELPVFLPVQVFEAPLSLAVLSRPEQPVAHAPPPVMSPSPVPSRQQAGLIEIELGDRRQVRVGSDVNLAALRRVLAALRG